MRERRWRTFSASCYILECTDGSLYTGITNDMERRMKEHATGKGAKYTTCRGPFKVGYTE
ncbi:MAG: hypothetical protein OJF52_003130 [Nitrospira sp.]|nr:MAG: hypothetical protein OJF52_003130 [Nitrospira sp.]